MAKNSENRIKLKPLPKNLIPQLSSAVPDWAKNVTQDIVDAAQVKGSPGFEPGPEQASQVEQMIALGMSPSDVSAVLRIEEKLLKKYYKYEIETASSRINERVAKIALQMALSGEIPDMTKFWLRTRAGWKETKVTEVTGANGGPIEFAEIKRRVLDQIESEIIDITPEKVDDEG